MNSVLLAADDLSIGYYNDQGEAVTVISAVSLALGPGETLGLVGESGCGKSTLLLAMMGYHKPGLQHLSGRLEFLGEDLVAMSTKDLQKLRGGRMALIPQNAGQSLTPTMKIQHQIDECLKIHSDLAEAEWQRRSLGLLERVKLPNPGDILERYPQE